MLPGLKKRVGKDEKLGAGVGQTEMQARPVKTTRTEGKFQATVATCGASKCLVT
jgi:hypothetical protein